MSNIPFERLTVQAAVRVSPADLMQPRKAILNELNRRLMRYYSKFKGVLLAHDEVIIKSRGEIQWDMPYILTNFSFKGLIFRPQVGTVLSGRVNKIGEDDVHMLLFGIFNVSVAAGIFMYHFAHAAKDSPSEV